MVERRSGGARRRAAFVRSTCATRRCTARRRACAATWWSTTSPAWAFTTGRVLFKSDGTPWRPLLHVADIGARLPWPCSRPPASECTTRPSTWAARGELPHPAGGGARARPGPGQRASSRPRRRPRPALLPRQLRQARARLARAAHDLGRRAGRGGAARRLPPAAAQPARPRRRPLPAHPDHLPAHRGGPPGRRPALDGAPARPHRGIRDECAAPQLWPAGVQRRGLHRQDRPLDPGAKLRRLRAGRLRQLLDRRHRRHRARARAR